jgi:hypothetical protein
MIDKIQLGSQTRHTQGLKMQPFFSKILEIRRDQPGPNLKIADFWNSNSEISKK